MSYRNPQHPGEVRTVLQTAYDRYVTGVDMFPRARWQAPVNVLPQKTQPAARALERAWMRIDEDEAYFRDAMLAAADFAVAKVATGELDGGGMSVVTLVGRNCVKMVTIEPKADKSVARIGAYPRAEFVEKFEGVTFNVVGDRTVTLVGGEMQIAGGSPDLAFVRGSNVSAVFLPQPPEQTETETVPVAGGRL